MSGYLKFRAWNSRTKTMQYTDKNQTVWVGGTTPSVNTTVATTIGAQISGDFIPMQFTGVYDKNKKEVYHGDLIQYKSYHVSKRWWSKQSDIPVIEEECKRQRESFNVVVNQVRYSEGGFVLDYPVTLFDVARGVRFKKGESNSCDTEEKQWDFEVVGNIYENPELLK